MPRIGAVNGMVRTLDLARWAGRWVALDENDEVQRGAESLRALIAIVDANGIEGVSIMRAPTLSWSSLSLHRFQGVLPEVPYLHCFRCALSERRQLRCF